MSDVYKTVAGFVQFEPETKTIESLGKKVRNVQIRNLANGNRVQVTLWPDHDGVKVSRGDLLFADGKYTSSAGQNKDGDSITYHNVSASTVAVISGAVAGKAAPKPKSADDETDGDGW